MSEETNELESLKTLADSLDVKYHPSIGIENLKAKIAEIDTSPKPVVEEDDVPEVEVVGRQADKADKAERTKNLKKEARKLTRVRISCMNPAKQGYTGEIFSAGNRYAGRVKAFIPFDYDWHVPKILLNMIQNSKCQIFVQQKERSDSGAMVQSTTGKLVKQYSVEILPDLTKAELADLAKRQALRAGNEPADA
jgi:hypothetical protein|tara:strand:- start:1310 stop:1891 length:582 start_codon:yes stop_codon:yes gene_type:complete